ncbi:MAG: hypothetical protein HYX40_13130 [Sphingobacteriales bacterium]|nr:hypothetical protein [Sphingobacteriales bacterium]
MNITDYINSGILQEYWLGVLTESEREAVRQMAKQYPEIAAELATNEEAMQGFSVNHSYVPPDALKKEIWQVIENLDHEKNFTADNTPIINQYSDYKNWLKAIHPLLPAEMKEDVFAQVIRNDGKITQTLIKTKANYPDEVHEDVYESFIVLEGECECYIGDDVIKLGPGGYLNIPLYKHHDVKVLTPYVTAVIQRIAV